MSTASSALIVPIDPQLASMIVANMLENWLDFHPMLWTTAEVIDEPEKSQNSSRANRLTFMCVQSTLAQVRHHQESTERQYALRKKALELGWSETSIRILDRDLGVSGAIRRDARTSRPW